MDVELEIHYKSLKLGFKRFLGGLLIKLKDKTNKEYSEFAVIDLLVELWQNSNLTFMQFKNLKSDYVLDLVLNELDKLEEFDKKIKKSVDVETE